MTEWGVVLVIVTLLGLAGAYTKPLIKWNTSLTENTMATKALTKTMEKYEADNAAEHKEIWDEIDKHDERISKLEH